MNLFGLELSGDSATWFTGLASLFVGIVALFGKRIYDYFFGPRLKLAYGDEWECTEDGDYGKIFGCAVSGEVDARVIRIKVENTGKETATKCYGKITRTKFNGQELQGFTPIHLVWASRQHARIKLFKSKSEIDLAPNDTDYLNVCTTWKQNQPKLMPNAAYPFNADKYLPAGTYDFQISIFGSNFSARTLTLEVKNTGKWHQMEAKEKKN